MTLTYVKGIPTPIDELDAIGNTKFIRFLTCFAPIYRAACLETVAQLQLVGSGFNKASWNTYLQSRFGINKRHANGVIADSVGMLESAKECRQNHTAQLQGRLKSAQKWLKSAKKSLIDSKKHYRKKNWAKLKSSCRLRLSCSLKLRGTSWQDQSFRIHHKTRYIVHVERKLSQLKLAPIHVSVPKWQVFVVGSKDETLGNQVAQWDGETITFRVPYCLESIFGSHVSTKLGNFDRNINRLPEDGAKSWHFFLKNEKWNAAVQFTPVKVKRQSMHSDYGCIGIDLNPRSVGWAYVDRDGNLKAKGKIPLIMGLPTGKQDQQIIDASLQLAELAIKYKCPVVYEQLDFAKKKQSLREAKGRKYARMLSGWAYSRFFELLGSILENRGVYSFAVNPAYSSLIGLVKYLRMYGLSSDVAAGLVVARRGMRLSERMPRSITALLGVKPDKHVWSAWNQLNRLIGSSSISRRHDYYAISNWDFVVTPA
jgi:hypothetical protein